MKEKDQIQQRDSNDTIEKYPSASVLLKISIDEYNKERKRTETIEKKAYAFISIMIAIFALYIPIIPFSKLIIAYKYLDKARIVCITVALCIMLAAIIFIILAFVNLYKGYKIRAYYRVEFSNLNDKKILVAPEKDTEKSFINHYNEILIGNAKINTEKAKKVHSGLKYSILSFALLSFSAIALIILTGGI